MIDGGPVGSDGGPLGPLGPLGAPWAPNPLLWVADKFETLPENRLLDIFLSKMGLKKVGIWAPGPPRRDPGRNSEPDAGFKVQNGATATHLVAKRCDLGSLGVPGPASTPGWGTDLQSTLKRPGKICHWNLTVWEDMGEVGEEGPVWLHQGKNGLHDQMGETCLATQ